MIKSHNVLVVLLVAFSGFAFAGISDVESYRDAQLVKSKSQLDQLVEIPMAKIRRAGSGWEPETVIRLQGDHFSSLYKIHRNALIDEVYNHYRAQLLKNESSILFECDSRSCGSSNAWANDFFGDYLLYGSDQSQYLLVVKNSHEDYLIMYLNRRGAGDVMVRLDEVKATEGSDTNFDFVAQMNVQDVPRIRRFVNDLPVGQNVIAFVSSEKVATMTAVELGDRHITTLIAGLGERLKDRVRFINVANVGRESLGVNRVSFVYVRP